ncbi:MAG TPA: malto-oligosyltrehalose synthase [Blastocatellia bacterium]|jgi:(1->4)-alpha-D-glucan 1-alpha-D-glucosylmutase|nr:malto-oligosyltrehalose synthase [Blastocatellia bacterium]
MSARIPVATYRLQFNHLFTLKQASTILDYLHSLGISDCYASPLFMARPGSLHGYDVIDPTKLNPELGAREDFNEFSARLKKQGMGLVIDVVPNHMCIAGSGNQWWNDVLENGPSSRYASFFDIDWRPPKQNLANKTLLPILGDQYGRVLENQEIQLVHQRGAFFVNYYETRLPIASRTSIFILNAALDELKGALDEAHPHRLEFESIITALSYLPPRTETDPEKVRERLREKGIAKRRLAALVAESREVSGALKKTVKEFNGVRGDARSFDRLEELLAEQAYLLCFWRVAADEINYRRFFDINELAAIRVEEPEVFASVHEMVFRLIKEGHVTGLRIDHIDGLYDPEQYLRHLQAGCRKALRRSFSAAADYGLRRGSRIEDRTDDATLNLQSSILDPQSTIERPFYVVVEKILGHDERLRESWAAHGTTGYGFLNLLNGLFVDAQNAEAFGKLYRRLAGLESDFADVAYESKKLVLQTAMSSESHMLARRLDRISEQSRYTRDFTLNSLQHALGEVIACFPVYRSYIRPNDDEVGEEDRRYISRAIRNAKRRNPTVSASIFDFIESLLLLRDSEGIERAEIIDDGWRRERREFVMRFQQLTGPVAAKGIEDTAFYRFYPLVSLCEVGGEPWRFGVSPATFHRRNRERLALWPIAMLASSTHDTKRSEDARARINALSEIPVRWYRAVRRWQNLNRELKTAIEDSAAPDANEEYLLYQTLLGAWPLDAALGQALGAIGQPPQSFVQRIQEYMIKALREAKIHSSWLNPDEEYEQAARDFISKILSPDGAFVRDFVEFQTPIARAGMFNSLSQTLLKVTAPGVPDFYQGTEVWDFSLVDPDNRRPIDYEHRKRLLDSLRGEGASDRAALADDLLRSAPDGRIKMFVTTGALNYRQNNRELFERGEYLPLQPAGERERHVVSFARRVGGKTTIVIAARFFIRLTPGAPVGREAWGGTAILMGDELAGCYRDVFTGRSVRARKRTDSNEDGSELPVAEALAHLPVALLERV